MGSTPTPGSILQHPANSQLVNFGLYLQREGYRPSTIHRAVKSLKHLSLSDPNLAKLELSKSRLSEGSKELTANSLSLYYKSVGVEFQKPIYKRIETIKFLPTTEEAIQLIAHCTKQIATFLETLRQTGARAGEAYNIKWTDFDGATVTIQPEKGSKPRQFRLSDKLLLMISSFPRKTDRIWGRSNLHDISTRFFKQRKTAAVKLSNPRLNKISFHTYRRLKASLEYNRTKDLLFVKQLLGHRSVTSTLKYIQLINTGEEQFVCKVASTPAEGIALIEQGFTFETKIDNVSLFKKRR